MINIINISLVLAHFEKNVLKAGKKVNTVNYFSLLLGLGGGTPIVPQELT